MWETTIIRPVRGSTLTDSTQRFEPRTSLFDTGVPGGSIMAAWPVLVGVLGFQEEAMGLMFALFLIQDSFGTAANITGDASIALIINKKFDGDVEEPAA